MKRYLFEYEVLNTNTKGEFSIVAEGELAARKLIVERVADMEFTSEENIKIVKLLKTQDANNQYFECEGCQ